MTATSIGPDSNQVLEALGKLKWLVVMDPLPTTSSEFWRRPDADPKSIQTEVFMVPTTHWIEKDGSFVNSGRWVQWKEQAIPPERPGAHDHWILADLFERVKKLYADKGGKFPEPLVALTTKYKDVRKPELDEIAQEINGFDLGTGKRLDTFGKLKDDGSTASGNWMYCGMYPESREPGQRRNGIQDPAKNEPLRHGVLPRLGVELAAQPPRHVQPGVGGPRREAVATHTAGHRVDGREEVVGDIPDYPATMDPRAPRPGGRSS